MLDALVYRKNGNVTSVSQSACAENILQSAHDAWAAVALDEDIVYKIWSRNVQQILGDSFALVLQIIRSFASQCLFNF